MIAKPRASALHIARSLAPAVCASFLLASDSNNDYFPVSQNDNPSAAASNQLPPKNGRLRIGSPQELRNQLNNSAASVPQQQADTEAPPANYQAALKAEQYNGYNFYGTADVYEALPIEIRSALLKLAKTNVLVATKENFTDVTIEEWRALPFVRRFAPEHLQAFLSYNQIRSSISEDTVYPKFFAAQLGTPNQTTGCAIGATMVPRVRGLVKALGQLPDRYLTPALLRQFPQRDLLTAAMLHEAAHCNQSTQATYMLSLEMDADQQMRRSYAELVRTYPQLGMDPDMGDKVAALRSVATFMPMSDQLSTALANAFSGQRTHNSQVTFEGSVGEDSAMLIDHLDSTMSLITYFGIDAQTRRQAEERHSQIIQILQNQQRESMLRNMSPDDVAALLPAMMRHVEASVVGLALRVENPEYAYYAAQSLEQAVSAGKPEQAVFIRQNMVTFTNGWEKLNLPVNETQSRQFSRRITQRFGAQLNLDQLSESIMLGEQQRPAAPNQASLQP